MSRIIRAPLLHFIVIGLGLFFVDARLRERSAEPGDDEIVVSAGQIEHMITLFVKSRQRAPTPSELRDFIDDHVLEEAYYREGLSMGLDRDDTIIRRRIRQKMEFVVNDLVELAEPSQEDLETWLSEHSADYRRSARFTFRQVYLNPDRRGESLAADAERLLAELRALGGEADPSKLGDPTLLEPAFVDLGASEVSRQLGPTFFESLVAAPDGEWAGPVTSTFGLHLVFIDHREEGELPGLAELREVVERDWRFAQRERASRRFEADLVKRFRVSIEWPEDLADAAEEPSKR